MNECTFQALIFQLEQFKVDETQPAALRAALSFSDFAAYSVNVAFVNGNARALGYINYKYTELIVKPMYYSATLYLRDWLQQVINKLLIIQDQEQGIEDSLNDPNSISLYQIELIGEKYILWRLVNFIRGILGYMDTNPTKGFTLI